LAGSNEGDRLQSAKKVNVASDNLTNK
jgi:hypothetical protein